MRPKRFELYETPASEMAAKRVMEALQARYYKQAREKPVTKSEAIRWAIEFADKALTEQINPEDLSDE